MSDREKKILDNLAETLPRLSDLERERLLGFGEGLSYIANQRTEKEKLEADKTA